MIDTAGKAGRAGRFPGPSQRKAKAKRMEFLSTQGKNVVDQNGQAVRLRGTCVGGWMNMEDFINGYSGAEHTLRGQFSTAV